MSENVPPYMASRPIAATGLPERVAGAFSRWEIPDEEIAVDLHRNVVELLERDVMRARGKMAAGLLLGRVSRGRLLTLTVEHYEPVTPERGVSASPFADRERMETMVNRWRPGQTRLSVIGLYRSCTPQYAFLTSDDLHAVAANMKQAGADVIGLSVEGTKRAPQALPQSGTAPEEPERVFLLIDPSSGGTTRKAILHITRGETVIWQSPPTSFNRTTLSRQSATNQSQVSEMRPSSVLPEQPATQEREDASAAQKKDSKKLTPLAWAAIAVGVAVLASTVYFQIRGALPSSSSLLSSSPAPSSDANLGLKLDQSGVAWKLSWNVDSLLVLNAPKGRLVVTDGGMHKNIDLDQSDLRGGTIIYSPITQDVILRLEVDSPDSSKIVSESVRTVSGLMPETSTPQMSNSLPLPHSEPAPQPVAPVAPEPVAQSVIPAASRSAAPFVQQPVQLPTQTNSQPAILKNRASLPVETKPVTSQPIIASKLAPPPPTPKVEIARNLQPAIIAPQPHLSAQPIISMTHAPLPVETKPAENRTILADKAERRALSPKTELARASKPTGIVSQPLPAALPGAIHRGGVVQLAQLISKTNPEYPSSAKQARLSGSVEVNFKIGTNGEVLDAVVSKGPATLASAAVEAVQEWRYRPARLDGVPVVTQGSAVIVFKLN